MINRRLFLIGLGAAAAVVATRQPLAAEAVDTSKLFIGRDFNRVNIQELSFSMRGHEGMPAGAFANYSLRRVQDNSGVLLWRMAMHPLATYRWVATPEREVVVTKNMPVCLEVEPCGAHSLVSIGYAVPREKPKVTRIWRDEETIPGEWIGDEYIPAEHIKAGWVTTVSKYACFNETFDVRDDKVFEHEMHALDPEDEHLIGA